MKNIIKEIDKAKHIEIVVKPNALCVATALYTYVLTKHKKVSLICTDKVVDKRYSFLPWFDKIKKSNSPSADLSLDIDMSGLNLFDIFKNQEIKINKKIATSLYGAIIEETNNFTNSKFNGTTFAIVSELIESGADYKEAVKSIINTASLAELRLKALLLDKMKLINSATAAEFIVSETMLKATGCSDKEAKKIVLEAFKLPYIQRVTLLNEEREIIMTIDKEKH